jgi:hypothetical protein
MHTKDDIAGKFPDIAGLEDEFMLHLGKCISYWSHIENELYQMCRWLLCSDMRGSVVYYRTPSVSSRIDLTTELLGTIFKKSSNGHSHAQMKVWNAIIRRMKDDLEVRNQLAHCPVGPASNLDGSSDDANWGIQYASMVSNPEKWRGRSDHKPVLKLPDLKDHLQRLDGHYRELNHFRHYVLGPMLLSLPPPRWFIPRRRSTRRSRLPKKTNLDSARHPGH